MEDALCIAVRLSVGEAESSRLGQVRALIELPP